MVGVQVLFAENGFIHEANTSANGTLTCIRLHLASAAASDSPVSSVTNLIAAESQSCVNAIAFAQFPQMLLQRPPFTQKIICLAIKHDLPLMDAH